MGLPWDDPNADPIGDIHRVLRQMREEYRNTMTHVFDNEGRCKYCEVARHNASKYPCVDEVIFIDEIRTLDTLNIHEVSINTKETNEDEGPVVAPV